jgi:hypothetical protein
VTRHLLFAAAGLLLTACSTIPIDGPTAPRGDPAAGKLTLSSGRTVWVYPKDLAFSGQARYEWPDGRVYEGGMLSGKPQGTGFMLTGDGERYSGMWNEGLRHGHGELTEPNGDHYVGGFVRGVREGVGTQRSQDGFYRGQWENDLPNGEGRFNANDGSLYAGQWLDGERSGTGAFTDVGGNRYEGEWLADVPHGFGILTEQDGSEYDGRWTAGRRDGYGTSRNALDMAYEGTWNAGNYHGFGILVRPDGSRYEGEWHHGKRQGQGRETDPEGGFHDGSWENNQPLGPGTRRDVAGVEIAGMWTGNRVRTGLVKLPTGLEYAGPLFKDRNRGVSEPLKEWLLTQATRGDPYAQLYLGRAFDDLGGTAASTPQAAEWYARAAAAGIAEARYRLALLHLEDNPPRAIELLAAAASQGHARANAALADCYLAGKIVPGNAARAITYLERAVDAGSVSARNTLARVLATTTDDDLRDGARAVALIRPLALYTENWRQLDTLAAALAETGAYGDAVSALELALARAEQINPREVQHLVDRLAAYRAQRPLRE